MEKIKLKKAELQKLVDRLFEASKKMVAECVQQPPVMFIVKGRADDGRLEIGMLQIPGFIEKAATFNLHRIAGDTFSAAILVMEAWSFTVDEKNKADMRVAELLKTNKLSVEELPQRKECIIFNVRSGKDQYFAVSPIDRKTKTLGAVKLEKTTKENWAGRAVGDGKGMEKEKSN